MRRTRREKDARELITAPLCPVIPTRYFCPVTTRLQLTRMQKQQSLKQNEVELHYQLEGTHHGPRVLRTRLGSRAMRRRAFLELLMPKTDLATANSEALAANVASWIGRDLADQPPILMKQLRALARHDCFSRLPKLAGLPTLVLSAEHDRIARPEYGRALAAAIPGATYEELSAASHGATLFNPHQINERLARFISSCESSPART